MSWLRNSLLLLSLGVACLVQAQPSGVLALARWSDEPVADGIVLHRAAFEGNLFGANQYLCVLEVAPGARFDIVPAADRTLEKTSALAAGCGAVAAVNGSFFNMRPPYGSVNYLRVDGEQVAQNNRKEGTVLRGTTEEGAVATFHGSLFMLKGDNLRTWEGYIAAEDVVTTGPVLIAGGRPVSLSGVNFNTDRHPRTAAGRRADGTVILLVADGRSEQAAGLSMAELQQVMTDLGCRDAINLDGGGSSAMVVRGEVVNHPSDNRQFDAGGERVVANAICISYPE